MNLTTDQKRMGMVVSYLLIVGFIVTAVLWFTGQIGTGAESKWYVVPALLGIPLALFAQLTCRLVPEDKATRGFPFVATIATITFVVVMIDQLQNGIDPAAAAQNIIIGLWLLALAVNFRSLVPIWATVATVIWAAMWVVDGFLHVLAAEEVWTWYDNYLFAISILAAMISVFAIGQAFRKAAAQG